MRHHASNHGAGTAAALAAARGGARTLLVEKAPFAGGIVTSVGLPYFDGIADTKDHRVVVRGIALELLAKSGVCGPDAKTMPKHNPTIPNTFAFKVLLDREFAACGDRLTVLYNSFVAAAERAAGRITAVMIANKDGLVRVRPRTVIDCTGDADVAAWAGVETVQNPELMPLTLHFRIGNVRSEPRPGNVRSKPGLSEDDIRAGRRFDDAIATGCWYFDIHPNNTTLGGANDFAPEKHQPDPYDIPFASLVPVAVDNLLVAGRCHSARRGAQSSTRVTVTAMALGEAAGTAAALASAAGTDVGRFDGREVRAALAKRGAGPFTTA